MTHFPNITIPFPKTTTVFLFGNSIFAQKRIGIKSNNHHEKALFTIKTIAAFMIISAMSSFNGNYRTLERW